MALTVAQATGAMAVPNRATRGSSGGDPLWVGRDAGPHGAYDQVAGMATSPDGATVFVAETSDGALVVVARDAASGTQKWRVRTPGPGGKQIFADAVALSSDGTRLLVTGDVEQSFDTRSTLTVAYDTAGGSTLWSTPLSVGNHHEAIPRRIAVSPDGARVFVTGSRTGTHGIDDFWDYFTAGYDAATGIRAWTATYAGPANGGDTAEGIGVNPDGTRVFVTGTSVGSTDRDFATVAYAAADGSQGWVARYDEGADDFAADLAMSPDGSRVYVAGFGRQSLSVPHRFLAVAYAAATGTQKWVGRHDDGGDDMATDLAVSSDGSRAFVTGVGSQDFTTAAFDTSTGQRLWAARYDGGHGPDNADSVAVSPDGTRVYVTGMSDEGRGACFGDIESTAYATVQYDAATGAQGWGSRYGGLKKDPDEALGIAVSADGAKVFVTGSSDFGCMSSDVATVAYQA